MTNRISTLVASAFAALAAFASAIQAIAAPSPLLLPSGATTLPADGASSARKAFAAMGKSLADDKSTDVYIVQYDPATTLASALRRLIGECGAKCVGSVPGGAYLVRATKAQCLALLESGAVETFRPYEAGDKGAPTSPSESDAKGLAPGAAPASTYTVSLFEGAEEAEVRKSLAAFGGCEVLDGGEGTLRVKMTEAAHRRAAALPGVAAIGQWFKPVLFNDVATSAMRVTPIWPASAASDANASSLGLTGKGQVVAVCDSGLDTGNLQTLHPDVRGRVVKAFAIARQNDWSDMNGHGTHVVGSVLGNGVASGGAVKGSAFEAELVMQSCGVDAGSGLYIPYNILNKAYEVRTGDGRSPRIHSDSWGGEANGEYDEESMLFDNMTFIHSDFLPIVSAGNEGVDKEPPYGVIDPGSMGAPGTAKNVLTVGAAETGSHGINNDNLPYGKAWPNDFPHDPIRNDGLGVPPPGGKRGMAAFSSRGPCADGRIKPDIVAPGCLVKSMRATANKRNVDPENDRYCYMQGTSMSTPLVSGTATLVRQWLEERRGIKNPDAATMKAVLCAGAKSLYPGQYGEGQYLEIPKEYPNNVEGWGMVDLENSVANPDGVAVWNGVVIEEKAKKTFRVSAPGGKPLTILMAYNDAEGVLTQGGLQNDLDMTVTDPSGKVWYPNSRTSPDPVNNVEGVRWTDAPAGEYVVTVAATRIQVPMDAQWTGGAADATRFSLVANGAQPADAAATSAPASPQAAGNKILDGPYTFFGGYCYFPDVNQGTFLPLDEASVLQVQAFEDGLLELSAPNEKGDLQTISYNIVDSFEAGDGKVFAFAGVSGTEFAFLTSRGELAIGAVNSEMEMTAIVLMPFDPGDTRERRNAEIAAGELSPVQFGEAAFQGCIGWLMKKTSGGN